MRFLARVLLLVQLVALVGSAVGAEAEVEARAEQLTVSGSGAAGKGVSCFVKGQTFLCPHDGGICCDGLAVCCPSGFKCSGSVSAPKCTKLPSVPVALTNPAGAPSSESSALSLSPKKKKKDGENDKKKKRKHRKRRHRPGPRIIQVILKNYNGGANAGTSSSLTTATKNGVPVAPSANGKQLFNLRKLRGVLVAPGLHKAVKGRIIGHTAMLPAKPVRAYAFWVKPTGLVPSWGSIFHVGNQNMERGPGVWFYPNKTSIHFRHSSQNNTNNGPDSKAENGIGELPLNVWTHVALTHDAGSVKIFYNGTVVSTTPNVQGPIRFVAPIYFSDPWHDAAKAEFRDIRLYPFNKGLTETEVKTIHALSKSNQLGPKKLDF